ncbi:uncharacterized protein LOC117115101 [Anneissia japonica]|uniref:uncharacterized protein LOC117115101 n=1 Tax=Anneissia japonica TaxID=1529436 RepID=UPI001425975D|nr:uncharacterized protein LOC117115101 [Anneissia japonica]
MKRLSSIHRLLLRNRCEPNEQTHFGDTALHLASSRNHLGVAKALIEAGTDITLLNSRARNAIQEAQIEGSDLVLDYFTKLFFEGNNETNTPSEISYTTITQTSRLPKNTEHRKTQEGLTDCRGKPETFADHTKPKKSSRWLHEISNGEYEFLGSSEEENDLSRVDSYEDPMEKLNIEPTSSSAQNRLKYLEETIGTLLTDYQKTKSELKSIQNELDETRNLLKSCKHNSCHHCGSRYHEKAVADDTAKPLQGYHETDRGTNAQCGYQRKVGFDIQL